MFLRSLITTPHTFHSLILSLRESFKPNNFPTLEISSCLSCCRCCSYFDQANPKQSTSSIFQNKFLNTVINYEYNSVVNINMTKLPDSLEFDLLLLVFLRVQSSSKYCDLIRLYLYSVSYPIVGDSEVSIG